MAYEAVLEARRAAEANQDRVREAVRLGLELKRETEERKAAQQASNHTQAQAQARGRR
jgi:hypothetical protein